MSKALRITLAAIAAILLVGVTALPPVTGPGHMQSVDIDLPEGG